MKKISDYVFNEEDADEISELELMGYDAYFAEDGSAYMVYPDSPEEAVFLASAAAQGDPEAIDKINGYTNPFGARMSQSNTGDSSSIASAAKMK